MQTIYVLHSDIHHVKYAKTRASSNLCFPVCDSVHMGKYGYDFVNVHMPI